MQTIQRQYKVYSYDELSDKAKEKVLQNFYDINVEYSWWTFDDIYYYAGQDYGIEIDMREACFDLDRGSYLYFDTHNHSRSEYDKSAIKIVDLKKFLKKAGFDLRKAKHIEQVVIDTKHLGGGDGKNYIYCDYATASEDLKMNNCLGEFLDNMLSEMKQDYEGRTSQEAVEETIRINEYEFLEDGSQFV